MTPYLLMSFLKAKCLISENPSVLELSAQHQNPGEAMNAVTIITILTVMLGIYDKAFGAEDNPPLVLDDITVTASHIPSSLSNKPANITIIDRKYIETLNPVSTVDLLRNVSGLHIDQQGGRGSDSSVYLRGGDPNFTVVLIDGIKVNDPTNSRGGSFDLSVLEPDSIERIEIVRGPLSSVYGSDAMSGAIHIITRHGSAKPRTSVFMDTGTDEYFRTSLETRGLLSSVHYALNISYVDDGSPVEGSSYIGKNINAKIMFSPSNTTWIQFVSRYNDSKNESFPDDSGGPIFAVLRDVDQRDTEEFTLGMSFNHYLSKLWEYTLKADYYKRTEDQSSPGVAPGLRDPFGIPVNSSDTSFSRTGVLLNTIFSPSASIRLSLGLDLQFEKGESDGIVTFFGAETPSNFDLDRTTIGPSFEAEFRLESGLTLKGGLRIDKPEDFDTEVSPSVSALYRINATNTTLKANWGEGFKLPSFFALGNSFVGNPDLVPETSRSFEVGFIQTLFSEWMHLSSVYFQNYFFNLVDLTEGPPPQLINQSEVETEGFEIEVGLKANDQLSIDGHVTYTRTNIVGTNEKLRNRPKWRGSFSTRWQINKHIMTYLGVLYVGKADDSSIPSGDRSLDDYIRTDMTSSWNFHENWHLSFAIDNLFDIDYEEAIGFPAPGIRPRIAVRLTF